MGPDIRHPNLAVFAVGDNYNGIYILQLSFLLSIFYGREEEVNA